MPRVQLQNDSKVKLYNPLTNTHRRQAVLLRQVRLQGRAQGTPSAARACSHGRTAVPLRQVRVSYAGPPRLLTHHHCVTLQDCLHTTIASRSMTTYAPPLFARSLKITRTRTHTMTIPIVPTIRQSFTHSLAHSHTHAHSRSPTTRSRPSHPRTTATQPISYSARTKSNLEAHARVHSGAKPFKCLRCNYTAARGSHLSQHERIHRETRQTLVRMHASLYS
jgi:hypothetical protein